MISNLTISQVGPNSWLTKWDCDLTNPTFAIFVGGSFHANTRAKCIKLDFPPGQLPTVDVRDGSEPTKVAAATDAVLVWNDVPGATGYIVEQFVGAAWVIVASLKSQGPRTHTFHTEVISDCTATQFRVSSVSEAGIVGTPGTVTFTIARHPDPPYVNYSYDDGTNAVTIAAA